MKTIKKLKNKISQGSVLVFTLIVLFIILTAAISIASITVIERKTSTSTGKSIAGFQTADSGTEIFLKRIQGQSGPLSGISGLNCSGNSVSGTAGSGTYTITFYNSAEPPQQLDCNADLASIDHIRSVGTSSGTTRAVEVAVAAGVGCESDRGWGIYVGRTTASYTGAQGGYAGADNKCQIDYPGSHVCRADEVLRSTSCGNSLPLGKYNSGFPASSALNKGGDCEAWTSDASGNGDVAIVWDINGALVKGSVYGSCNLSYPFLCCR